MKNNFKKIALFRSFYGIEGFEIPTLFKDRIKEENEIPINIQLANLIEDLPINTDTQPFYDSSSPNVEVLEKCIAKDGYCKYENGGIPVFVFITSRKKYKDKERFRSFKILSVDINRPWIIDDSSHYQDILYLDLGNYKCINQNYNFYRESEED